MLAARSLLWSYCRLIGSGKRRNPGTITQFRPALDLRAAMTSNSDVGGSEGWTVNREGESAAWTPSLRYEVQGWKAKPLLDSLELMPLDNYMHAVDLWA